MNIIEYLKLDLAELTADSNSFLFESNSEIFSLYLKYYENITYDVNSQDDFMDFIFLWKQTKSPDIEIFISDDIKKIFKDMREKELLNYNRYKTNKIISFINLYYQEICQDHIITLATFKFIKDKLGGIKKEVIIEIAKCQPNILLNDFKNQIKYFKKNADIVELLISESNVKELLPGSYSLIFKCALALSSFNEFKDIVNKIEHIVLTYMSTLEKIIKKNNIIEFYYTYSNFCDFLNNFKSKHYLKKLKKSESFKQLLDEYIVENGKQFSFKINGQEFEKNIGKFPPQYEIMQLTHNLNIVTKQFQHAFKNAMTETNQDHFINMLFSNKNSNDFFTPAKLHRLNGLVNIHLVAFNQYILYDKRSETLFEIIRDLTIQLAQVIGPEFETGEFVSDINILESAIFNLKCSTKENKTTEMELLNYAITIYSCAIIEKILRAIYAAENRDKIYFDSCMTLGDLLNDKKDKTLIAIFGFEQIKCLRYFLIMDNEVGENIRNKYAHLAGMTTKDFKTDTSFLVLWLFLGVFNSIVCHYIIKKL